MKDCRDLCEDYFLCKIIMERCSIYGMQNSLEFCEKEWCGNHNTWSKCDHN